MFRTVTLGALLLAATHAQACGGCGEDKMAAVYEERLNKAPAGSARRAERGAETSRPAVGAIQRAVAAT